MTEPCGGRLGVGVGQPGVEREHRHLDAEAHEHAAEDQPLGARLEMSPFGDLAGELDHVEGLRSGEPVERQEADEHERRTEQGEQEELDGGVQALLAAPDADHEVHREQHDFEEDEEQHEVLGHEAAEHAGVEHQDQDQERLGVPRRGDVVPRVDDDQRHDEQCQCDQRKRDAVDADRVPGVDDVDPRPIDDELQRRGIVEVEVDGKAGRRSPLLPAW